ncbi:MAG: sugar ABC transporter substrate-binding protein [Pseudoclavibacter sp.]
MKRHHTAMRRRALAAALTGLLGLALVGCSTEAPVEQAPVSADITAQQEEAVRIATERVEAAKEPAVFQAPGPAFSVSDAAGKKVFLIAHLIGTNHFTDTLIEALTTAFDARDVELVVRDAQANPAKAATVVDEAINQDADLILGFVLPTSVMDASFKAAQEADIPVIQLFAADPHVDDSASGVVANVSFSYSDGMALVADYAVMESDANVRAAVWESTDVGTSQYSVEGLESEFAELCPETCTTETLYNAESPVWAQRVPGQASAAVADSNVNWLLPVFDGHINWLQPAVQASGRTDISMAGFNGGLSSMQQMESDESIRALVHSPVVWGSWAAADQALRVLVGEQPVDQNVPLRIFDHENMPDLSEPEGSWMGADFQSGYESLWED